jgi:hypothetical protein
MRGLKCVLSAFRSSYYFKTAVDYLVRICLQRFLKFFLDFYNSVKAIRTSDAYQ